MGRAFGAVTNSSNPARDTAAIAQGLALYKSKTSVLLKGQSDIVSYVSSVVASPAATDLVCYVDPSTGQLVGLRQAGAVACSTASSSVVVPMSTGGYISQVKLAYTYDGAFVGRLVFELKANANAKTVTYTCGSAGGKAVSLLPNSDDDAVSKLDVGCAPLPPINGGGSGRRRLQSVTPGPGLGLSAGTFGVVAAPLAVLPTDPATGVPLTSLIGDVLVPGGTPPSPPGPSNRNWQSVASSGDGTKLVAAVNGGQLYTSTDSGANWTARDSNRNWQSVASSSDGTKLVAAVNGGQLYISADSGANWTARDSNRNWQSVASGRAGNYFLAADYGGQLYRSIDGGASWTAQDSNRNWQSVSCPTSESCVQSLAAVYGGQLYTSTDSGASWTARDSNRNWSSVSSGSASKLVAAVYGGQLYTSTDSGANWIARDSNRNWQSVASSGDGTKLVAAVNGGQLYTSTDSGANWTARDSNRNWQSVASSSDGTKLVAAVNGGQLYISANSGASWTQGNV